MTRDEFIDAAREFIYDNDIGAFLQHHYSSTRSILCRLRDQLSINDNEWTRGNIAYYDHACKFLKHLAHQAGVTLVETNEH